jgi:hypothetical protein
VKFLGNEILGTALIGVIPDTLLAYALASSARFPGSSPAEIEKY